jgi:hypothetical protein
MPSTVKLARKVLVSLIQSTAITVFTVVAIRMLKRMAED